MKGLLLAIATLFAVNAQAFTYEYTTGDKIHFQKASAWVNALYNKTLCFDGTYFQASVTKCVKESNGDNARCLKWQKVPVVQPAESTRQVCTQTVGENGCAGYKTVRYYQSPNRTVKFYNKGNKVIGVQNITVPACGTLPPVPAN